MPYNSKIVEDIWDSIAADSDKLGISDEPRPSLTEG
jgi:hypothetical protein